MERWCIPRLAGSPGSYEIVEMLKEDFKHFNFEFAEQKFPVFKSDTSFQMSLKFLIMAIMFTVFLLLFWFAFWYSLLALLIIIPYFRRVRRFPKCTEVCSKRMKLKADIVDDLGFSQSNLVYRLKATEERKINFLLMAHHDSKSQTFPTESRVYLALFLASVFLLIVILYIICIAFELLGITTHLWLRPLTFVLGWIIVGMFLMLSLNRISNNSPGALDNASGMYTLWKTANFLYKSPLKYCEVWFILTGAEEIGQIGAAEFLNKFKGDLEPKSTYILNFEMIGLKNIPLKVLASYSFPRKRKISPFLLPIAFEAAKNLGIELNGWYLPIGANTDGLLFRNEGYTAMDFVSRQAGRYTHLPKDKYELIDPKSVDDQARLNVAIIEKLDKMYK